MQVLDSGSVQSMEPQLAQRNNAWSRIWTAFRWPLLVVGGILLGALNLLMPIIAAIVRVLPTRKVPPSQGRTGGQ